MQPWISIPVTIAILYRSYSHNSLTPLGNLIAGLTATIHALHPSPLPFTLLLVFFLLGTSATKIKKDVKANLTLSSRGSRAGRSPSSLEGIFSNGWDKSSAAEERRDVAAKAKQESNKPTKAGHGHESEAGGQEPRSAIQVLANSGCVSLLCLLHIATYGTANTEEMRNACFGSMPARDLIFAGIIANYAAVMADTLSSELGILSAAKPRFILTFREVAPGTNGGVTGMGLGSGLAGALIIGFVSVLLLPGQCEGTGLEEKLGLVLAVGSWGGIGSVLDSVLGALFQASVVDRRSGKVIEAPNGGRVKYLALKEKSDEDLKGGESKPSRLLGSGRDMLDNNQVNFVMAATMTVGAMIIAAGAWEVPLSALWITVR